MASELSYEADRLKYRLRQIEPDGTSVYAKTVSVWRGVMEVTLLSTYPHSARSRATIRYPIPDQQRVTIRLCDLVGRRVRTVVDEEKGRKEMTLHLDGLAGETYFLRLSTGAKTKPRQTTMVR